MKKLVALILCLFLAAALFAVAHADPSEHQVTLGIYETDSVTVVDGVATIPVHAWLELYAEAPGADSVEILVDDEELEIYDYDEGFFRTWWETYDAPSTYTVTVTAKAYFGQETVTDTMPITVTVGPELQGSLTYTVSGSTTVPLDSALTVIINNLPEDVEYYIAEIQDNDKTIWSKWTEPGKSGKTTMSIPFFKCTAGKSYTIRIYAWKTGSPLKYAANLTATASAAQVNTEVIVTKLKSIYETCERLSFYAYYPNPDELDIGFHVKLTQKGTGYIYMDYDDSGDTISDSCPLYTAGDYTLEISVVQYVQDEDPVVLTRARQEFSVTAPKGKLNLSNYKVNLPARIQPGEPYELVVPYPGSPVEWMNVWVYSSNWWYINSFNEVDHELHIPINNIDRYEGQGLRVQVSAYATGYEPFFYEVSGGLILAEPSADHPITISVDHNPTLVNERFNVNAYAKGAYRLVLYSNDGYDWSSEGERRTYNDVKASDSSGAFTIWIEAYYRNEETGETETYVSEPLTFNLSTRGTVGNFSVTLSKTSVQRGSSIDVTLSEALNADEYGIGVDLLNGDWVDIEWSWKDKDRRIATLQTFGLSAGQYRIYAWANGTGYETSFAECDQILTVTELDVPEGEILLIAPEECLTCNGVYYTAYAPGAYCIDTFVLTPTNDIEDNGRTYADTASDSFWPDRSGEYLITAVAHYHTEDTEGNPVDRESEPKTVTVNATAPYGPLTFTGVSLPSYLKAGNGLHLAVPKPIGADYYSVRVEYRDEYWNWYTILEQDENDQETIQADWTWDDLVDAGVTTSSTLYISLNASGTGYDPAHLSSHFPVVSGTTTDAILTAASTEAWIHNDVKVTVRPAGNKQIQGARIFRNGSRDDMDDNGDGTYSYDICDSEPGTTEAYALVTFDPEPEAGEDDNRLWLMTNSVAIEYKTKGQVGDFTATLSATEVTRGDTITVTLTEAEHADDYWLSFSEDDLPYSETDDTTFVIQTLSATPGKHTFCAEAGGEEGYQGSSTPYYSFTVLPNDEIENGQIYIMADDEAYIGTYAYLSIYAPGADEVAISFDDQEYFRDRCSGDILSYQEWCDTEDIGKHTLTAYARYEGSDEWQTKTQEFTVISKGQLQFTDCQVPAYLRAGEDAEISIGLPENAAHMLIQVYVEDPEDGNLIRMEDLTDPNVTVTIPGNRIRGGEVITLWASASAPGYEDADFGKQLLVEDAPEDTSKVQLEISKTSLLTSEWVTYTVTAPGATEVRYFNGNESDGSPMYEYDNVWTQSTAYYQPGQYTVYAKALIGEQWYISEPQVQTVTSLGRVGAFGFEDTEEITVARGESFEIRLTEAEHATQYILLIDPVESGYSDNVESSTPIFTVQTGSLEEGRYRLSARATATGYDDYDLRNSYVYLTVTEPEDDSIRLILNKTNVLTREDFEVHVFAPQATEVLYKVNGQDENSAYGPALDTYTSFDDPGIYTISTYARYEGSDEWIEGETKQVTVSLKENPNLTVDISTIPLTATEGQDLSFSIAYPEGADSFGYSAGDGVHDWYDGADQGQPLTISVDGANLTAGRDLRIDLSASGVGYYRYEKTFLIPILPVNQSGTEVTLEVEPAEKYLIDQEYTVEITAEGADEVELIYDGWSTSQRAFTIHNPGTYNLYAKAKYGDTWKVSNIVTIQVETLGKAPVREVTVDRYTLKEDDPDQAILIQVAGGTDHCSVEVSPYVGYERVSQGFSVLAADLEINTLYTASVTFTEDGYEPATVTKKFELVEPFVRLTADPSTVSYGETVQFTVEAPFADPDSVSILKDGTAMTEDSWTADTLETVTFTAEATFSGTRKTSSAVKIRPKSLGKATAPKMTVDKNIDEGLDTSIKISDVADGVTYTLSVTIGGTEVYTEDGNAAKDIDQRFEPGSYQATLTYSQPGHTNGTATKSFTVTPHNYKVQFTWDEEYNCTAKPVCSKCNAEGAELHVDIDSDEEAATCTDNGLKTWIAEAEYDGMTYTDTKKKVLPAQGHQYEHTEWEMVWDSDTTAHAEGECDVCHETVRLPAVVDGGEVISEATCDKSGETKYTATVASIEFSDTNFVYTDELGHDWSEWTVTKPADHDHLGEMTSECSVCHKVRTKSIPKTNEGEVSFENEKDIQKGAADRLAQAGDSAACAQLIAAAKAKIDAMAYDSTKTPEENQAAVQAIITQLKKDLAAQRAADAKPKDVEKVTLSKLKSVKLKVLSAKKIEVSWKKLSKKDQKKIQKIQIQYSTDKTFKTGVKTKWVKKTKASVKISGLKKNTKYYIRIRAYKKEGNTVYVSKWITKNKKTKKK